jgi:hypothetical protein
MEQTNPEGGVAQELSDEDRVSRYLEQPQGQAEGADPSETPESEVTEGQAEITPDDIPDDPVSQPAVDAFEIVHNGQSHKLTREDTIKYAMQGFDYTQKTQAVAAKDRAVTEHLQRLAQVEQVQPYLQNHLAQVKAMEAQIAPYQNLDWVKLATDDPLGYPKYRAQYDTLLQGYQQAFGQYQRAHGAVAQQLQAVRSQRLQGEASRLPELVPEWRDPGKLEAARGDIAKHYQSTYGIDPAVLDSRLDDAISMAVVYKAMKYDQLVKSKADKSKTLRTAPPVTRPGAAQLPDAAKADQRKALTQKLRKSGDLNDAAALLLNLGYVK